MSIVNDGAAHGIGQYRLPHNYELAGRSFSFETSEGMTYLAIHNRKSLSLNGAEYEYECHKIDNDVYFICFGSGAMVLDEGGQKLYMLPNDVPEGEKPCEADDMGGTDVVWTYGYGRKLRRVHGEGGDCTITWTPGGEETPVKLRSRHICNAPLLLPAPAVRKKSLGNTDKSSSSCRSACSKYC